MYGEDTVSEIEETLCCVLSLPYDVYSVRSYRIHREYRFNFSLDFVIEMREGVC